MQALTPVCRISTTVRNVPLRPSAHARQRMKQRGIALSEIEEVLLSPRTSYASREYPGERTVVLGETSGGRRLKVVIVTHDPDVVVTVADRSGEE